MICGDCATAGDYMAGQLRLYTLTMREHARRGHDRCKTRSLSKDQSDCDCQHQHAQRRRSQPAPVG